MNDNRKPKRYRLFVITLLANLIFSCCLGCSQEEQSDIDTNDPSSCDADFDYGNFCKSQNTKDDCYQANLDLPSCHNWDDFTGHSCIWRNMIETSIEADGNCRYGDTKSYCEYGSSRGEDSPVWLPFVLCYGEYGTNTAFYIEEDDKVFLGTWEWRPDCVAIPSVGHCEWNLLDGGVSDAGSQQGELLTDADECQCVCVPGFPM